MASEKAAQPLDSRACGDPDVEGVSQEDQPASIMPKPPVKGLLHTFRSLRNRNYSLYWFGQMISVTGDSMQTIGLAWLVLQLTHSAWQLGLVSALQFVPTLLFSL